MEEENKQVIPEPISAPPATEITGAMTSVTAMIRRSTAKANLVTAFAHSKQYSCKQLHCKMPSHPQNSPCIKQK